MRKTLRWIVLLLLLILLPACGALPIPGGGSDDTASEDLPTTTPRPTLEPPAATETPLPPPTVTPFPSITPEGFELTPTVEGGEDTSQATPEGSAASPEAPSGPAVQPTATGVPVAGINSNVPLVQRLYIADFTSGSWPEFDEEGVDISLAFNGYLWEIGPSSSFWMNAAVDYEDLYFQVEADVQSCSSGAADAGFGLRFRLVDSDSFYYFGLWCSNAYSFFSRVSGVQGPFLSKTALPATFGDISSGKHVVGVLVKGNTFTFYLDGEVVDTFEFEGEGISSGDVAMYVQGGSGTTQVLFDNLEIYEVK